MATVSYPFSTDTPRDLILLPATMLYGLCFAGTQWFSLRRVLPRAHWYVISKVIGNGMMVAMMFLFTYVIQPHQLLATAILVIGVIAPWYVPGRTLLYLTKHIEKPKRDM